MKKLIIILVFLLPGLALAGPPIYLAPRSNPFKQITPMVQQMILMKQQHRQDMERVRRGHGVRQDQPVQKYNPYSKKHQTVYPDSQLNYNSFTGKHEYTRPGAEPVFNPYTDSWEFPR